MFEAFRNSYPQVSWIADRPASHWNGAPELRAFFSEFGGKSFQGGVYRVIHPSDVTTWHEHIALAFPDCAQHSTCFGYDWLGRVFALDSARSHQERPAVLLFDPGFGEVLQIPANLETFHDEVLLEDHDAAVASTFYELWMASGGGAPRYDQCVGYKKPCFLGGVDDIENIELGDLDVYWHFMCQLIEQVRGLPPGSRVRIKSE